MDNNEIVELLEKLEGMAEAEYSDYELAERARKAIHSQQFQSAGGHWVPFAERWPNQSPALDNPDVKATDTVLVTNNINARDRMGRMSHVWYAAPIESSNGGVVAYDNGDRKIEGLTHWFDPLAATQPKEVELVSRDERAKARNALLDLIIRAYRHGSTSECCTREEAIDAVNTLTLAATHSLQSDECAEEVEGYVVHFHPDRYEFSAYSLHDKAGRLVAGELDINEARKAYRDFTKRIVQPTSNSNSE